MLPAEEQGEDGQLRLSGEKQRVGMHYLHLHCWLLNISYFFLNKKLLLLIKLQMDLREIWTWTYKLKNQNVNYIYFWRSCFY